eukprot:SAG11_NODE_1356_length_5123_cov_2.002787_2_plen_62_part_00
MLCTTPEAASGVLSEDAQCRGAVVAHRAFPYRAAVVLVLIRRNVVKLNLGAAQSGEILSAR